MLLLKSIRALILLSALLAGSLSIAQSVALNDAQNVELTNAERQWLLDHPVIRIGPDPDFAPFEWLDENGQHRGISADYIALLEKKLGIRFNLVRAENWTDVLDLAKSRSVDVLPAIAPTDQRAAYLRFTKPYQSTPGVVVSSQQYGHIEDLRNRSVAVVRGYYWDDILSEQAYDIKLQRVDSVRFAIELTALGAVDALVTDLASATTAIRQAGVTNLSTISDPDNALGKLELAMGVRKDWPLLQSILNKALDSINLDERQKIQEKWIRLNAPSWWLNRTLLYSLFGITLLMLIIFSSFIVWNRTLSRKVEIRTRQLHQAQEKLMQAEKMESIGRLAAGIAHEVKNPLAIIQMGMDYLTPELPDDPSSKEVTNDINDAVQRANQVIHGLLDFSRDKKLALKPGNINEVIRSALHLVEHELHQRSIEATTSLAASLPAIDIDRNKIQQVFINLFMNAAHAMQHEGTLQVSSQLIDIDPPVPLSPPRLSRPSGKHPLPNQQAIKIEVTDTGPGIRPQDKEKIFELFYTTKAVGEGTGLGLSVTRNIIKLHHGSIDIDNRPEGGARVTILFKLQTQTTP